MSSVLCPPRLSQLRSWTWRAAALPQMAADVIMLGRCTGAAVVVSEALGALELPLLLGAIQGDMSVQRYVCILGAVCKVVLVVKNIIGNLFCEAVVFDAVLRVTVAARERTGDAANPVPKEPGVAALVELAGGNPQRDHEGGGRAHVRVDASCGAGRAGANDLVVVSKPLHACAADVVVAAPTSAWDGVGWWWFLVLGTLRLPGFCCLLTLLLAAAVVVRPRGHLLLLAAAVVCCGCLLLVLCPSPRSVPTVACPTQ